MRNENKLKEISYLLQLKGKSLAVAESFTSGALAAQLTKLPGSSSYFRGGIVAYHPCIKNQCLQIPKELIEQKGVVNESVAIAMAENVKKIMKADFSISTTGVAGPGKDEFGNEVGTAWVGISSEKETKAYFFELKNKSRAKFTKEIISKALEKFYTFLQKDIQ